MKTDVYSLQPGNRPETALDMDDTILCHGEPVAVSKNGFGPKIVDLLNLQGVPPKIQAIVDTAWKIHAFSKEVYPAPFTPRFFELTQLMNELECALRAAYPTAKSTKAA